MECPRGMGSRDMRPDLPFLHCRWTDPHWPNLVALQPGRLGGGREQAVGRREQQLPIHPVLPPHLTQLSRAAGKSFLARESVCAAGVDLWHLIGWWLSSPSHLRLGWTSLSCTSTLKGVKYTQLS